MKMKVFTVDGVGKCSIRRETIPELKTGDVLIKVAYAGICGTDMSFYTGETSFIKKGWVQYPVRVGHEYSGVVEVVGPGFNVFKKGDRVFSDTGVSCGVCEGCIKGTGCRHGRAIGTIGNHYPGAMAEYMLIHQRHVHPMPKGMTFKNAALIEPASIAYNHMDCNKVMPTSEVAIMGTGPIGLAAVPMYKAMGAAKVIMIGRSSLSWMWPSSWGLPTL
jgi:threonine dehydrogenase-like Zn-dependent dehydrogenase